MNPDPSFTRLLNDALVESSLDGVLAFDRECRYTVWNPAMERISGRPATEVVGRSAFEIFPFLPETGEDHYFREALAGRSVISMDRPFSVPETGHHGFYEGHYRPIRDERGAVIGGLAIIRDITAARELQQQREAREAGERQLRLVADAVPALIAFIDRECRYRTVNRAYEDWFGLSRESVVGKHVREVVGESTWEALRPYMEQALRGETARYEQLLPVGDHPARWFSTTYTPRRDERGEVDGFVALVQDITAQKAAEERQRLLAEASRILGSSLDYETTLQQVARLALPHLADLCYVDVVEEGQIRRIASAHVDPQQEGVLRQLQQGFAPDWSSPAPAARVLRSGEPELLSEVDMEVIASHTTNAEHLQLIRALGIRSHIAVPLTARGEKLGAINLALTGEERRYGPDDLQLAVELARCASVAVDNARFYRAAQAEIEERRRAEERVKLHSRVLESMREGVSVSNEQGVIIYTNPAEDVIFGYEPGELIGQHVTVLNAYPEEENARIVGEVIQTLKREGVWLGEWRNRKKDGALFTTRAQITALEMGGRQFWVCVQEDVTAERQAQETLRENEERLRLALDAARLGDWSWDPRTDVVTFSDRATEIFGLPTGWRPTWRRLRELLHPEDREPARRAVETAVKCGSLYDCEYRVLRPDGSVVWVAARGRAFYDAEGRPTRMLGAVQDITAQKDSEAALQESEAFARQVINSSLDCVKVLDLQGTLLSISVTGQQLLELENLDGVLHTPWVDFWTEDREAARAAVEAARAGGVGRFIGFCPTAKGRPKWWDVVVSPLPDASGKPERLLSTSRDITDTRSAEAELREQARIIETVNRVGQVLAGELDLQKLLQALTEAATEITSAEFGSFFYNVVDDRGESFMLYTLSGAPREAFSQFPLPRNTAIFAPTFSGEGVVRLDDVTRDPRFGLNAPHYGMPSGHLPVRSYLAAPVISRTGEVLGGLFFGHARTGVFTERHERVLTGIAAQAAIAIDNARLYKQARDAEHAATARAEELAQANRQKDEFLAMLAHELRNPLGAISNSIHVMSRTAPETAAFRRAQEVAARQVTHQMRMVDDLLDVSRIERGKIRLHPERVDLARVVRETAEDHRTAMERAGVSLTLALPDGPVVVNGDPVRLAQVVGNLLDNARKFTAAGGQVTVELACSAEQEALLTVRDTGIGIDAEMLGSLFAPFTQADRTLDRSRGGLGLGLALVKGLVELHPGGSVRAMSPGCGSGAEFRVSLPLEQASVPLPGAAPAPERAGVAPRVLVVEDIQDAAETLRDLLELFGCEVEIAFSGADGLARAAEFRPDVVLCDIGLPGGLNGYDVAARLRANPATSGCRLVALTGYGAEEDKRRAREAGFDEHLTKPVQPEQLQALLAETERLEHPRV